MGVQVETATTGLFLSQCKYLKQVLEKTYMLDHKPIATPMTTPVKFEIESPALSDATKYKMIVGSLQYRTFPGLEITFVQTMHVKHIL